MRMKLIQQPPSLASKPSPHAGPAPFAAAGVFVVLLFGPSTKMPVTVRYLDTLPGFGANGGV